MDECSLVKPEDEWVCLNFDGAAKLEEGVAGCGGVLQKRDGQWIHSYSKNLGFYHAFVAEL